MTGVDLRIISEPLWLPRGAAAAVERRLTPSTNEDPFKPGQTLSEFAARIDQPLAPHQAAALTLERKITAVVAPRQAGKSRAVSVLALHRATEVPGLRVLIVSAGETAAVRLLDTIRRMALAVDPVGTQLSHESRGVLKFTNGSEIRCVPASERQIRGWTIDLLIIDEAALVDDDLILSAAIPTTSARDDARIVLVSSPILASGAFYRFVTDGERGDADTASARWRLTDSPWISRTLVEAARRSMPPLKFAAEYEGEFPESGIGVLIPRPWIMAAVDRDLPGIGQGAMGVDVAEDGADWTTIYRVRDGVVREVARVNGQTTMETANQVAALMHRHPALPVAVDAVGVGSGTASRLLELGYNVIPFKGSRRPTEPKMFSNFRAETYWWLREAFEDGLIDLDPLDAGLVDELAMMRYEVNPRTGKVEIESKESMRARGVPSPDRADAFAMAWSAVRLGDRRSMGRRTTPVRGPASGIRTVKL